MVKECGMLHLRTNTFHIQDWGGSFYLKRVQKGHYSFPGKMTIFKESRMARRFSFLGIILTVMKLPGYPHRLSSPCTDHWEGHGGEQGGISQGSRKKRARNFDRCPHVLGVGRPRGLQLPCSNQRRDNILALVWYFRYGPQSCYISVDPLEHG